jgi:hypothetical protein
MTFSTLAPPGGSWSDTRPTAKSMRKRVMTDAPTKVSHTMVNTAASSTQ